VPRSVTLVLCSPTGRVLGALEPFTVDSPWWADVEPVAAGRDRLGSDLTVLRLLDAEGRGGAGGAGGACAYLAQVADDREALPVRPLPDGDPLRSVAEREDPLRMPWARPGGVAADVAWADRELAGAGTPRTGPAVQVKSWNLSSVLRLPTAAGAFWCKQVPLFFVHEGALLATLAASDPDLVPVVVASRRDPDRTGAVLMAGIAGVDQWEASEPVLEAMLHRWIGVQARWAGRLGELAPLALPDWRGRPMLAAVRALVARPDVRDRLADAELAPLDDLAAALPEWVRRCPRADPARAMELVEPLAALRAALIYRRFLDGIEESERRYHADDVPAMLRIALASSLGNVLRHA
jgi:hypothetical protein